MDWKINLVNVGVYSILTYGTWDVGLKVRCVVVYSEVETREFRAIHEPAGVKRAKRKVR